MITITELTKTWTSISAQQGQTVGRRADNQHPLDIFITYDENCSMQMLMLSDFLPNMPRSSREIIVRTNPRNDGRYALCFVLADENLREQFICLCWDIMDYTFSSSNKSVGIKSALKRFSMWQKLFAENKDTKLSEAEIKGLIGELLTLKEAVLKRYDPVTAVSGWIGPLGADRDFEFADTWYEAKTTSLSKDTVTISSLDQLDTDTEGNLLILRIEKAAHHSPAAITLKTIIAEIREILADTNAEQIFESRLLSAKYSESDEGADLPFIFHKAEIYQTDSEFPRIRRSDVHTAISNSTYDLSIPAIQSWRQN